MHRRPAGLLATAVAASALGLGIDARISIDTPTDLVLHLVEGSRRRTIRIGSAAS